MSQCKAQGLEPNPSSQWSFDSEIFNAFEAYGISYKKGKRKEKKRMIKEY